MIFLSMENLDPPSSINHQQEQKSTPITPAREQQSSQGTSCEFAAPLQVGEINSLEKWFSQSSANFQCPQDLLVNHTHLLWLTNG